MTSKIIDVTAKKSTREQRESDAMDLATYPREVIVMILELAIVVLPTIKMEDHL